MEWLQQLGNQSAEMTQRDLVFPPHRVVGLEQENLSRYGKLAASNRLQNLGARHPSEVEVHIMLMSSEK